MSISRSAISVLALCLLAGPALSVTAQAQQQSQGTTQSQGATQSHGMAMDPADNPADKAFIGAMHDMMVGMHQSMPTGDTDKDFVRMMLPHHQAAVDMAKTELQYGKDPELKALATDIVAAQDKEIGMMKAWSAKHAN